MKFCPNVECPQIVTQGLVAEYDNGDNLCSTCGTSLVDERPIFQSTEHSIEFDPENGWVSITNPLLSIEAQIICDRLNAKGIPAHVTDDTVTSFFILTTFGGAHVMVREQDVNNALQILL